MQGILGGPEQHVHGEHDHEGQDKSDPGAQLLPHQTRRVTQVVGQSPHGFRQLHWNGWMNRSSISNFLTSTRSRMSAESA